MEIKVMHLFKDPETQDLATFADKYGCKLVMEESRYGWTAFLVSEDGQPLDWRNISRTGEGFNPLRAAVSYVMKISDRRIRFPVDGEEREVKVPVLFIGKGLRQKLTEIPNVFDIDPSESTTKVPHMNIQVKPFAKDPSKVVDFCEFADKYELELVVEETSKGWEAWLVNKEGENLGLSFPAAKGKGDTPLEAVSNYAWNVSGHTLQYHEWYCKEDHEVYNNSAHVPYLNVSDKLRDELTKLQPSPVGYNGNQGHT